MTRTSPRFAAILITLSVAVIPIRSSGQSVRQAEAPQLEERENTTVKRTDRVSSRQKHKNAGRNRLLHIALAHALFESGLNPRTVQLAPGVHQILIIRGNSAAELTVRQGDPDRVDIRAGRNQYRAVPVTLLIASASRSELREVVHATLSTLRQADARLHASAAPPLHLKRKSFTWFGGEDSPPPFTVFLSIGPTVSHGEVDFTLHALLELNLFYGHLGLGMNVMVPAFSPVMKQENLKSQFYPIVAGIGPRFRLGADTSLFSLDLGINVGAIVATTVSSTNAIPAEAPTEESSREYSVDGGTWSGLTVSVRIAQDFYIRSGVWLGVSFDKISVSTAEQEISTWGQPFGSLFAGAEVRLP